MLTEDLKTFLSRRLSQLLSGSVHIEEVKRVSGGSINVALQLIADTGDQFFLKINDADLYPGLFERERLGLESLGQFVRTPIVLMEEVYENKQLLVMEWISPGTRTEKFWKDFGAKLALLHQQTGSCFGLNYDNFMGSLKQANGWRETWVEFFRSQRLEPQVKMAADSGLLPAQWVGRFENLYKALPSIFPEEKPGLLHGDLWSGNFMCTRQQEPVLIDPAIYYGHRAVDLGMTTLFGRCSQDFYEAYHYHFPLEKNYEEQWEVANLYPLMIHLNLFGGGYLEGVREVLKQF
ncbi:MAG: hypothetical protein DI535_07540 [Citrobacter freundii]|nr:MAG: hypothetical protein DI535_07540 [Citrobacter freundii]